MFILTGLWFVGQFTIDPLSTSNLNMESDPVWILPSLSTVVSSYMQHTQQKLTVVPTMKEIGA